MSFSFDSHLTYIGWPLRHIQQKRTLGIYQTDIEVNPYGIFIGAKCVATMRTIKRDKVDELINISKSFKFCHGTPIYVGDDYKNVIGVQDITKPKYCEWIEYPEDEVPAFWVCGLTLNNVMVKAEIDYIMCGIDNLLVCDRYNTELLDY